ncbi:hypothetical protein AGABI2DRAFT_202104 [Agaricus bisporus var. bisporus H97]|uniref:hypothetical protein n=1 Tax=Agaricus bisporus var. bisporus (strain H97 / ATCC MYA-4626 / FGSC 10389) TaxID=936046 RepID=UPI00029F6BC3|nr:hypothetical protein AGABI2DRAFT_202104 [Agaricus bisporus var. bisporus H97]EKV47866.1 hypothetical protein AGABI2DRAFT_202104 [Agaricus bisporus var. bisporus H97]
MLWSSLLLFSLFSFSYGHLVDKYQEDISSTQTRLQQNLGGGAAAGTLHLSSVASDDYTVLRHSRFPNHRIRVRKTAFCDQTVNVYTGYLDVDAGAKHLFFYFFESRRDPDKDDVMMWINGGPGCSSAMGLLMELGPCSIDMTKSSPNGTVWNPHSWNQEANIFFLDQPVGVGFSYADYGETIETTEDAAKNVQAFISIFFETFSQFTGRRLHLAGESYGGRYLPVFASEIYDQNQIAVSEGRPGLNLKSVLIGNGITDISTLYLGRYEVECGRASLDVPFQSISACVRMKMSLPRCQERLYKGCIDRFDAIDCRAAVDFCDNELSTSMWSTGRNVYDISKPCEGNLCYKENDAIAQYLDLPEIRELLGVEIPGNFSACSDVVGGNFNSHLDKWGVHTQDYVANLLDRGVRILIYAGTYDWQCNWIANKLWVDKLSWSQSAVYQQESWREWMVNGRVAGEVKQTDLLTFVTIREAGHMVPHDKPAEAWAMVSRWLTGAMM